MSTNQTLSLLKWRDPVTFGLAVGWDHLYLPEDLNLNSACRLLGDMRDKWKQLMPRMYELIANESNVCFLEWDGGNHVVIIIVS